MPPIQSDAIFSAAQARASEYLTPVLRLGVTGLSRSGKTVFVTALVRNLIAGGRLPFFRPEAEGRIVRAYLEPQPNDEVPRFSYEDHLACLSKKPPVWPDNTRRISQLRLTIEYQSQSTWRRFLGLEKLHVDIIDYPGEWLVDLALLGQTYAEFSALALETARSPLRAEAAKPFLDFVSGLDPQEEANEQTAIKGGKLFAAYLDEARRVRFAQPVSGPGRFLLPGDLEGSPLLTFFPLPLSTAQATRGSLVAMMARRYESYKEKVVQPFFADYFSKIDRQIVLVDVLSAISAGHPATDDLERALDNILAAFRPGQNSWLSFFTGKRIDKVLFAATKADLLPSKSHDRLGALLKGIVDSRLQKAQRDGAGVSAVALAAVRSTQEVTIKRNGEEFPCIKGVPMPGESAGGKVFDGVREAVIFPGDLPLISDDLTSLPNKPIEIVSFRPPLFELVTADGAAAALAHIRLDRALDFLLSDYLT